MVYGLDVDGIFATDAEREAEKARGMVRKSAALEQTKRSFNSKATEKLDTIKTLSDLEKMESIVFAYKKTTFHQRFERTGNRICHR